MHPHVEEYATSDAVNWDHDFIWIQETSLLQIVARSAKVLDLRRHDGTELSLPRDRITDRYFEIREGTCLKPHYRPVKAHVLSKDQTFRVAEHDTSYPEGSAILRYADGYEILHKDVLMRDYEAVSDPSDQRFPETPFPV